MANKPKGGSKEGYFAKYKASNKFASNRKIKLERLQKEQPNNKQITLALQDIRYRRRTPTTAHWSHSQIAVAKLFKEFLGKFDKNTFHKDPKISEAAMHIRNENMFVQYKPLVGPKYSWFSMRARVPVEVLETLAWI